MLANVTRRASSSLSEMNLVQVARNIITLILVAEALRLVDISIPNYKQVAGTAILRCMYDLGPSTNLYSIKWYKNGGEFYRYLPQDVPQGQAFNLPGIVVDLESSDEYQVTLRSLTLEGSGIYKCEVSTEAPMFHTVTAKSAMTVVSLPTASPVITGLQKIYSIGEFIEANCTSMESKPVTQLAWYINGGKANSSWLVEYGVETDEVTDLDSTTIMLRTRASKELFRGRVLSLRCIANLAQRTWQTQGWTVLYRSTSRSHGTILPNCMLLVPLIIISWL